MLLIRAILLWSILSLHVVGGAALFRRFFPKESPWFGFVVPCLALVIGLNFTEHFVAIPSLLGLLPFTALGSIWAIFHPKLDWNGLRLPTGIFLAAFAFTLAVRSLNPDILVTRDGIFDLGLMSSFCTGDKVPPPLNWDSDLPLSRYYAFEHYAASVLTRFLGLDTGTGFNVSVAFRGAFDCFFMAAAAWRIGRQKIWVTILAPVLLAGAANGATAYLWFGGHNLNPNEANSPLSGFDDPDNHSSLLKLLHPGISNELMPPGGWIWTGSLHSTCGGQFLILFMVWVLAEVLRRKPANWPWICLGTIPLLTIVTSAWALPLEALLLLGALFWIFYYGLRPRSFRFVALGWSATLALMAPTVLEYLTTGVSYGVVLTPPAWRTQGLQLLIQWWPIYLPWLFLVFSWRKLSPTLKIILIFLPIAFILGEIFTVADRVDWTGKFCSFTFAIGWIALIPAVFARPAIPFRVLGLLLILSSLFSFWVWGSYAWHMSTSDEYLHLEGTGSYHRDPVLATLLETMRRIHGQTVLTGLPTEGSNSPPLAAFTNNRVYLGWGGSVRVLQSGTYSSDITQDREEQVDAFYNGKCDHPLLFLRSHDIDAAVIYPDDKISSDTLKGLKKELSPYYDYVDCRCDKDVTAGVFFFHPEILHWPPGILLHPIPSFPASLPAANK